MIPAKPPCNPPPPLEPSSPVTDPLAYEATICDSCTHPAKPPIAMSPLTLPVEYEFEILAPPTPPAKPPVLF